VTEEPFRRSTEAIDLARSFGPMAAMHAALDSAGVGMPCGMVARFSNRDLAQVERAVAAAVARFPVLHRRLVWSSGRALLVPLDLWRPEHSRAQVISLAFTPDPEGPVWRYALTADGRDVWFTGLWAHSVADGRSMLHFLATTTAELDHRPASARAPQPARALPPTSMARWLPRFLVERHLPYVRLAPSARGGAGVASLTVPREEADVAVARARTECGGVAARLAAAASLAWCEQERGEGVGRVSLNLLISRDARTTYGGFGFGAGSLLMPVEIERGAEMAGVGRRIFARQRAMMAQGWDEHFERFLGDDATRHRWFAALEARGASAPTVSVSWKGDHHDLGGRVEDVACFAVSRVAHVSAHRDAGGLSISVTSRQTSDSREALLTRIADLFAGAGARRIRTLRGLVVGDTAPAAADAGAGGRRPVTARVDIATPAAG
jgi:hypothetical protein